jgi:hypothetical protein
MLASARWAPPAVAPPPAPTTPQHSSEQSRWGGVSSGSAPFSSCRGQLRVCQPLPVFLKLCLPPTAVASALCLPAWLCLQCGTGSVLQRTKGAGLRQGAGHSLPKGGRWQAGAASTRYPISSCAGMPAIWVAQAINDAQPCVLPCCLQIAAGWAEDPTGGFERNPAFAVSACWHHSLPDCLLLGSWWVSDILQRGVLSAISTEAPRTPDAGRRRGAHPGFACAMRDGLPGRHGLRGLHLQHRAAGVLPQDRPVPAAQQLPGPARDAYGCCGFGFSALPASLPCCPCCRAACLPVCLPTSRDPLLSSPGPPMQPPDLTCTSTSDTGKTLSTPCGTWSTWWRREGVWDSKDAACARAAAGGGGGTVASFSREGAAGR